MYAYIIPGRQRYSLFEKINLQAGTHYIYMYSVHTTSTTIGSACKSKLYDSGTGLLQHRSRPGRDIACQGKGKFGTL